MSFPEIVAALPKSPQFTWLPFNSGHVMTMDLKDSEYSTTSKIMPLDSMLEAQAQYGHAITALLNGRPVAVFGTVKIWQGVGEMWMICEERLREHKNYFTRAAIAYRDYTVIAGNLHRLQITVRCADLRAVRWALFIGFEIDGMMKRYGPDQSDFYMMSRS